MSEQTESKDREDENLRESRSPSPVPSPITKLRKLLPLGSPRFLVGFSLLYFGAIIALWISAGAVSSIYLMERFGAFFLPILMIGTGVILVSAELEKRRRFREERFVDVDARGRLIEDGQLLYHLLKEIRRLESTTGVSESKLKELLEQTVKEQSKSTSSAPENFAQYFDTIRRLLELKAAAADEKASILLDKGTSYSRWGIFFYIVSIIVWQGLALMAGFQPQFIYGIASCSLLFIFIEFLSAWFLRQYRQFVDTSTYLIKVKSILDRYMLVYLVAHEAVSEHHDSKKPMLQLIDLLRGNIDWPDTYLTKNPDISFAKEAVETISLLARNIKDEVKDTAKIVAARDGKRPNSASARKKVSAA